MAGGSFTTCYKAPTEVSPILPEKLGGRVTSPLMFMFQREGPQVLEKDNPGSQG